jgi:hypothetical protein
MQLKLLFHALAWCQLRVSAHFKSWHDLTSLIFRNRVAGGGGGDITINLSVWNTNTSTLLAEVEDFELYTILQRHKYYKQFNINSL